MKRKRILVIEDEFLIAADMESLLKAAGAEFVGSAATESDALLRIEKEHWDAAVADANLNGRGIRRVAAALLARGIPMVIVTGYGRESLPSELKDIPALEKPFDSRRLIRTLERLLA